MRVRKRLRNVDEVISTVAASGVQCRALTRALELPTEAEMDPCDKYTTFSRKDRGFRKSVHKVSGPHRSYAAWHPPLPCLKQVQLSCA